MDASILLPAFFLVTSSIALAVIFYNYLVIEQKAKEDKGQPCPEAVDLCDG